MGAFVFHKHMMLFLLEGPSTNSPDADQTIDYNFAQQELMMKEFSNDPISEAISAVEKQYEEDKQGLSIFSRATLEISAL